MGDIFSICLEKIVNGKNGLRIIAWIFIFVVILAIVIYPIIDANILYFNRVNKRIDILERIIDINENDVKKDKRIEKEYYSIIEAMNAQSVNQTGNIFVRETGVGSNIFKFVSGAWLFAIVGIMLLFTRDKITGKIFSGNNLAGAITSFVIAAFIGYVCMKIPNIFNIGVNAVLYQIMLISLAYIISKSNNKKQANINLEKEDEIAKEATNE